MGILKKLLGLDNTKHLEHYDKAVDYAVQGDLPKATEYFREALRLAPDDNPSRDAILLIEDALHQKIKRETLMHLFLGAQYASHGYHPEALTEFRAALSLDPNYPRTYRAMGGVYNALGRTDEAITELKKAISLDPNDDMAHYDLGVIYNFDNRLSEAIAQYHQALKLNPEHGSALNNLAFCYRDIGRRELMIEHRDKALALGVNVNLKALNRLAPGRWIRYSKAITDDFPLKDGPRLAWSVTCPVEGYRQVNYSRADLVLEGFDFNCIVCGSLIKVTIARDSVTVSTFYKPELR